MNQDDQIRSNQATFDIGRDTVIQFIKSAFDLSCEIDYAFGFISNEEDMRANVYRHVRAKLDIFPKWRVFANLSLFPTSSEQGKSHHKPDLLFFHWADWPDIDKTAKAEILVEIKHGPKRSEIIDDIKKLNIMKGQISDPPVIVFLAITGEDLRGQEASDFEAESRRNNSNLNIWLRPHYSSEDRSNTESLYKGPYDPRSGWDPWRRFLRERK